MAVRFRLGVTLCHGVGIVIEYLVEWLELDQIVCTKCTRISASKGRNRIMVDNGQRTTVCFVVY